MATTRIIPMHIGKGRTIAQMLTDGTDYGKNPEKANQGELISAYAPVLQAGRGHTRGSK